jgi:predicted dienelactone hydrolase
VDARVAISLLIALVPLAKLPGQQPVGMLTRNYVDAARLSWDGRGPRPIRTSIWYPALAGLAQRSILDSTVPFTVPPVAENAPVSSRASRYPIVLLSHGTGGSAIQMMWLGHRLAASGYIVAAVSHHGNTALEPNPTPQGFLLYWERARDLAVALRSLASDSVFGARIDTSRIGAAGFSLGGYTVLAVAGARFNPAEYDRFCTSTERDFTCEGQAEFPQAPALFAQIRKTDTVVQASLRRASDSYRIAAVKGVFAIAPALGGGFTRSDAAHVAIPVSIVAGDGDQVAPIETNARRFATIIPGAQLTVLSKGVGHYTFLAECTERGVATLPVLCVDAPSVNRREVHERIASAALAFFDRVLQR